MLGSWPEMAMGFGRIIICHRVTVATPSQVAEHTGAGAVPGIPEAPQDARGLCVSDLTTLPLTSVTTWTWRGWCAET